MTVGETGNRGAELQGRGRGTRYSYEQPEVVVQGSGGGHAAMPHGEDV